MTTESGELGATGVVQDDVVRILEEMTAEWETDLDGGIGPETRLAADLGFGSINVVHLAVELEEHFHCRNLPFHELLMTPEGRYVEDLRVADLVGFLQRVLDQRRP